MLIYLSAFGASVSYVTLKAFQQLSVVHHKGWAWITPVSLGMGFCEVFIIGTVSFTAVKTGGFWPMVGLGVAIGLGGACGAMIGMSAHKRLR